MICKGPLSNGNLGYFVDLEDSCRRCRCLDWLLSLRGRMKVLSSMGGLLRDLAYLVTQVVTWKLFAYLSRGGSSGWYVFVFIYIFLKNII